MYRTIYERFGLNDISYAIFGLNRKDAEPKAIKQKSDVRVYAVPYVSIPMNVHDILSRKNNFDLKEEADSEWWAICKFVECYSEEDEVEKTIYDILSSVCCCDDGCDCDDDSEYEGDWDDLEWDDVDDICGEIDLEDDDDES